MTRSQVDLSNKIDNSKIICFLCNPIIGIQNYLVIIYLSLEILRIRSLQLVHIERTIIMSQKILVAYGTGAGSTAEVAEAIGEEMGKLGATVDVKPVEELREVGDYDAIVVGSAVRAFRILAKTRKFLRRQRKALQKVPVAYFLVCLTMSDPTPENIEKATSFAKPMMNIKQPVSLGLFGGCMNHDKLEGIFAQTMKSIPEQDHRDWEQIRNWAKEVFGKFSN